MMRIATIEFDGGTSCNIPRLGFGKGYGSFRINGGKIRKIEFADPMSCNAAEIATMALAIAFAKAEGFNRFLIKSDSMIALKWANVVAGNRKATKLGKASDSMQDAVMKLRQIVEITDEIQTQWQPRLSSVAIFGH
jgi:ribonuclease HI